MKLTTILRHGEARPALVITNDALRCKWCVDLIEVNEVLASVERTRHIDPIPRSVLQIAQGGSAALDSLKWLQDALLTHLDTGDRESWGAALLSPETVYWLPPIPDAPLFITFHGNSIGLWRDRAVAMPDRRITARVPFCRLHPVTSTLGHQEPLVFPSGTPLGYGNELGVVLAPGGKRIPFEDAHKHIWGITNCNDVTRSDAWPLHFNKPRSQFVYHESEGRARLGRASDASTAFGPWITTCDEVPDVHDLLIYCYGPDGGYSRAHSWAYNMGPRNAVAYFSRFMTLPAGTILQLGAPGVDGVGKFADVAPLHGQTCEASMERVGTLANPLWCEEMSDTSRHSREGFYGLISRRRGMDVANAISPESQPFPHGTRTVWATQYNDRTTALQAEYAPDRQRHFEIFPRHTLSTGGAVILPQHANEIRVSCELAAVVGRRPIARVPVEEVSSYLEGLTIMVGFRDSGLLAELDSPTRRERLAAAILGRWADGFNAVRPELVPVADMSLLGDRLMRISLDGVGEKTSCTSDYLLDIGQIIAFLSKEITLLPGDVVSLGAAGQWLVIPAERRLRSDAALHASIEGIGDFTVPLTDERGKHAPLHEVV